MDRSREWVRVNARRGVLTAHERAADAGDVVDNAARQRFELTVDGSTAYLAYERTATTLTLVHTEVPPEIGGRHFGQELVKAAAADARADGLQLVALCPFARDYLRRHGDSSAPDR